MLCQLENLLRWCSQSFQEIFLIIISLSFFRFSFNIFLLLRKIWNSIIKRKWKDEKNVKKTMNFLSFSWNSFFLTKIFAFSFVFRYYRLQDNTIFVTILIRLLSTFLIISFFCFPPSSASKPRSKAEERNPSWKAESTSHQVLMFSITKHEIFSTNFPNLLLTVVVRHSFLSLNLLFFLLSSKDLIILSKFFGKSSQINNSNWCSCFPLLSWRYSFCWWIKIRDYLSRTLADCPAKGISEQSANLLIR